MPSVKHSFKCFNIVNSFIIDMQITHRHIDVFRAVMTTSGSVTEAAALLHTSQPTVSRELARLEQVLGYALFERLRGRLKATARALARHPAARVTITPQESPLLEEWMSAQRFDMGLTEQTATPPGTRSTPLLALDEVCVLPEGHALLAKTVLMPEDFAGQDFVSLSADDPYRMQLDTIFSAEGIARRARVETHSAVAVCAMVSAGLGLAIVNPLTALACAGPSLHLRRFGVSVPFRVNVLTPQYRPVQPLVADLIECLAAKAALIQKQLERTLA